MTTTTERPVLVIGATGKVGRRIVDRLDSAGAAVRPASRSSRVRFDWGDASTWAAALDGVGSVYVTPSEHPVDLDRFLDLAEAGAVERFVLLSARHPDQGRDGVIPAFEDALSACAIPSVLLRPSWFVQNFTEGMFAPELAHGGLRLPVGAGGEPFIDTDDIAAVAVAALTSAEHDGRTYELSGPEVLTFAEALAQVGAATGRDLHFTPVEPDAWAEEAAAFLPPPIVTLLGHLFAGIREGENAYVSPGVAQALGRPPRSMSATLAAAGTE